MILLCHDTACEGHNRPAGESPDADCAFCGAHLTDALGAILALTEHPIEVPLMETSLRAVAICQMTGHSFEGVYLPEYDRLAGRCARCGLGIVTDGE